MRSLRAEGAEAADRVNDLLQLGCVPASSPGANSSQCETVAIKAARGARQPASGLRKMDSGSITQAAMRASASQVDSAREDGV